MNTLNKLRFLIFFFSLFITQNIFSQSTGIKDFLPLNIGNTWIYHYNGAWPFGYFSGFEKYKIISSYIVYGKQYYKFTHSRFVTSGPSNVVLQSRLFKDTAAIRNDSLSCNIYRNDICHGSQEMLVDSLNARLNDTSFTCEPTVDDTVICSDTASITYFDTSRISRKFETPGFEGQTIQTYAMNLGLVSYTFQIMNQVTWGTLKGCIINGVVYGDTSMVGIKQISGKVPENFSLSQNYPNPFNPVTKIKFFIAKSCHVKLSVFNVLGQEIAILTDRQYKAGIYDAEWDGTNYSSAVYFYKLSTPDYTETKKMVLLK